MDCPLRVRGTVLIYAPTFALHKDDSHLLRSIGRIIDNKGNTLMFARIGSKKNAELSDAAAAKTGQKPVIFKVRLTLGDYVVREEYILVKGRRS